MYGGWNIASCGNLSLFDDFINIYAGYILGMMKYGDELQMKIR